MRDKKQNVFDDFIAAAEWLEQSGWSHRDRIAIRGGSNGGLLVSAAVTQRPELFQAVLCAVPLADMVRFHRLGLANIWTEEQAQAHRADVGFFHWDLTELWAERPAFIREMMATLMAQLESRPVGHALVLAGLGDDPVSGTRGDL